MSVCNRMEKETSKRRFNKWFGTRPITKAKFVVVDMDPEIAKNCHNSVGCHLNDVAGGVLYGGIIHIDPIYDDHGVEVVFQSDITDIDKVILFLQSIGLRVALTRIKTCGRFF